MDDSHQMFVNISDSKIGQFYAADIINIHNPPKTLPKHVYQLYSLALMMHDFNNDIDTCLGQLGNIQQHMAQLGQYTNLELAKDEFARVVRPKLYALVDSISLYVEDCNQDLEDSRPFFEDRFGEYLIQYIDDPQGVDDSLGVFRIIDLILQSLSNSGATLESTKTDLLSIRHSGKCSEAFAAKIDLFSVRVNHLQQLYRRYARLFSRLARIRYMQ